MAYIRTIPLEEAAGSLRDVYEQDLRNLGYVANSTRALSLRPEAILAWRTLIRTIRVTMDPRRYELVTIAAAAALRCSY